LDGNLDQPAPKNNGKIRVKALQLPIGVSQKKVIHHVTTTVKKEPIRE
jgi:hypothetical protein